MGRLLPALALALLSLPGLARAELPRGARYTTVFAEQLDGAARPTSIAENRLVERLLAEKIHLVDDAQSRRLRAQVDAKGLIEGRVPDGLSAFETDLIIAAVVALSKVESTLLPENVHRYDASLVVKVIEADSGRVALALSVPGRSMGHTLEEAASNAARAAADALATELISSMKQEEDGPRSIELIVEGLKNVADTERLIAKLLAVPGITGAKVRFADRAATRLELKTTLPGTRELAAKLSSADLTIEVFGYGDAVIRAEMAAGVQAKDVSIESSARVEAGKVHLSGVLLEKGQKRATGSRTCPRKDADECARRVASDLAAAIAPKTRKARPLEISALEVTNVFPARLAGSTRQEVGRVTLVNKSSAPIEAVRIEVRIPRFAERPPSTRIERIEAKREVRAPLAIALDPEVLARHDEDRPVVLTISVEYTAGDLTYRDERSTTLVIHDRNALSWDDTDSVAAFVTPRSQVVLQTARALQAQLAGVSHPLALAAALFAGMTKLGVHYAPDPSSPFEGAGFDYLQYPAQTLAGGGDCDDLTVLFASLAEAIGVRTLIVTTPGHALVAVPTGLPPQSMHLLSGAATDFLVSDGHLYVPIETTALSGGFLAAWKAGATELARFRGNARAIHSVDVRSAWKRYPPVDLSGITRDAAPVDVRTEVGAVVAAIEKKRRTELEAELASVQAGLAKKEVLSLLDRRAVLLAQLGRPEAKSALEEIIARHPEDAAALANLGSLHLTEGRPKDALPLYRRALEHATKQAAIDVHLNAALAAFVLGDEATFTDHVVSCLEAGAKDRVAAIARAGFGSVGDARGGDEPALRMRDLALAIERAAAKSGRTIAPEQVEEKRAQEATEPVGRFVVWL